MKDAATMTDMNFVNLEEECCHLRCEQLELKKSIKHTSFDEKDLNGDDEKVNFYTGLPTYATLMAIFNFVSTHIPLSSSASLANFQQFLIVLMKLRLNLFDKDLAYCFGISQPSVSRFFRKWIDIMFLRVQPLVKWPG